MVHRLIGRGAAWVRLGRLPQRAWRLEIRAAKHISAVERAQFYDPSKIGQCYAQAWSMVYFLRKSPVVTKHAQWSKTLDAYFVALKEDYGRRMEFLEKQGRAAQNDLREDAGQKARAYALELAFQGVDVGALEEAWREFVEKLEYKAK